jgi:type 1 glutamine amidotransferase
LLSQTAGVAPVLALDWPKKGETFADARAVVLFFDGGPKHAVLAGTRAAQLQRVVDSGAGLVQLHQAADYPKDFGDRARGWAGAAWEAGYSKRAHWVAAFRTFPAHPVCRGVTPFHIDDGWLYRLRFVPGMAGITPLLRTTDPKDAAADSAGAEAIVAWAYDRPGGGRAFTFTGGHLHRSLAEAGYRRFLVNGILWAAGVEVPPGGAPVALAAADLDKYLGPPHPAK